MTIQSCVMTFATTRIEDGVPTTGTRSIRIPNPRSGLTPDTIQNVAGRFTAVQPFDESVGTLTGITRAQLVTETRNVLFPTA
jgi:hypothetical protein